jgi:integrase/recombinase XerC
VKKRTASTANAHLAAVDHLYIHLALFINRRGGRLSTRFLGTIMNDIGADAGLTGADGEPRTSPHVIRHTFGTNLVRGAGVDIVLVAELMGHKQLDSTRRYTLPTEADLMDAVSRLPTGC